MFGYFLFNEKVALTVPIPSPSMLLPSSLILNS
jgi:hypothetical protein